MVGAYSSLQGILFIRSRPMAFLSGMVTTVLAFLWFFVSEPRNVPDTDGGLEGNQMSGLFAAGAGIALALTLLVSSIRNRSMGRGSRRINSGLDALRETNYINALSGTIKNLRNRL